MKISPIGLLRMLGAAALVGLVLPICSFSQGRSSDTEVDSRVGEIVGKMTLDEKLLLISGIGFETVGIKRLGIPALRMTDGPAGVRTGQATSFPSGIALAATFDPKIVYEVAKAIAQEAKAAGKNVLLGPCVNIQRNPFGGRNFESFGEDPYLAAQMAVGYIEGIQSENVIATVKHYAANNQERDRLTIDVRADERALHEIYFPAFKAAVQKANVWGVMSSYNRLNGPYTSESKDLLADLLKGRWGFRGLVMSDWGAVHSTVPTLKNGLDLEMPLGVFLNKVKVKQALAEKQIAESQIDEMVKSQLRTMIKSGIMDGKTGGPGSVDTAEHRNIALRAAQESIVLLQNKNNALPIDISKVRSIAVIGPNADVARIGGGGSAEVKPYRSVSPLEGIKQSAGGISVSFTPGVEAHSDTKPIPAENLRTPDGTSNGLAAEYFDNMTLEGTPALTRVDPQLDFHWATSAPAPNIPADKFSNRWAGQLVPTVSGRYSISLSSNDGGRLYLDDKLIVDVWGDHATLSGSTVVELKAGESRKIRVEHYENTGNADLVLGWRLLSEDAVAKAVETAGNADVAVVFVGLSEAFEAETLDRTTLDLPREQEDLIRAVTKVNPRTIVVVTSGGPIVMSNWLAGPSAIMQAYYYGEEGGSAIADVLFGKVSPSGKLPATFLKRWEDSPAFGRYPGDGKTVDYTEGILVGYRWFDQKRIEPEFPFGHGLSYTNFKYSNLKLIQEPASGNPPVTVRFDLENTGTRDGAEAAQIYVQPVESSVPRPFKELKGFEKVFLKAGEKKTVTIPLDIGAFSFYDPAQRGWVAEKGAFKILVGSSSRDIRTSGSFTLKRSIATPD
ncbi:MAG: glycoside hydrolase family 3 C-terminal domain-containing protein [Acidobacteriota bacterium]